MPRLLVDASLPALEAAFPPPFSLIRYQSLHELKEQLAHADALLCRSTLEVDETLLKGASLSALATASSGTSHIDKDALAAHGIILIDAKGCNAVAVADYVVACLAHLAQRLSVHPKTAGVIGMGEVGTRVEARLRALNLEVHAIDPPRAVREPDFNSADMDVLSECDLICLHADLHDSPPFPTRGLLNADRLKRLKQGAILLNAARGELVDEAALLKTRLLYCTDVWHHEPDIHAETVAFATLCTPHIAGHSIEGKNNAVWFASARLHRYFGLAPVEMPSIKSKTSALPLKTDWATCALALYDPLPETRALKAAKDKKDAFLTLRKAHTVRHDFGEVCEDGVDPLIQCILGMK
ncbi:erythronate-4-phosphate dehydrogenase [Legionella geestiana]|uniref:Erythronate-4-phosphate dehydrogenase n=1 Tax=Legionella geestiana TaxID=45065 RepID=A0A0W0TZC6_9GAMM|nr:4-phosphoerythronate dehydrogenase [Legionella geestiana]KTD00667.1 erythronate-4-phosphate dehydrogenase [Legionella geestiana]QBS11720.1 4-phosphoerythronate dehydrogenase [Legionella geestiana]STX53592.1 erythronate-4-phosphate dehydrogenase [Legionella geestiana]